MSQEELQSGRFQCVAVGDSVKVMLVDTATGDWKIYTTRYDPPKCLTAGNFETDEPLPERAKR